MTQTADAAPGAPALKTLPPTTGPVRIEDTHILEALKRCSASTREAACEFRRTGSPECLPAIVVGLIEHYVQKDARAKLSRSPDNLRLVEDLAIDSLTMLEIVFTAEDILQISIDNEELRPFRTVGDIKGFIAAKIQPRSAVAPRAAVPAPVRG